ncbi:hypothetical protein RHMOL_Rhmol06G0004600 [Rhododendron molle]|uniref:Uncharacterized protein n=1 Tax=Rhododendron molle TaxID=49168 RepID=A0ACC0N8D7_RHOML|nr:hypothetical protein RHMOL_Rhmol06G0004600 [Rhododendron molle]
MCSTNLVDKYGGLKEVSTTRNMDLESRSQPRPCLPGKDPIKQNNNGFSPPQTGIDDATKAATAAKAAKSAKATAVTEKATKAAEAAKTAVASKTRGDQITLEVFAQMQKQIKKLTQGLQTAMQENADLQKQISEPSILNLQHSRHEEEDHREESKSSEKESENRKKRQIRIHPLRLKRRCSRCKIKFKG